MMRAIAPTIAIIVAMSLAIPARADVLSDQLQLVDQRARTRTHHRMRIAAVLVASAGAASIVVGAAHGIGAVLDWHQRTDSHDCDHFGVCNPAGVRLTERSQSLARGADLLIGSGALAIAIAGGLWLSARDVHITPIITPSSSGAVVTAQF